MPNALDAACVPDSRSIPDESKLYARLTLRLIPFLFLCYVFAYLDRVNVGFAKLQMLDELKFSETVYGLGAGIFFFGYFIFEVPSNMMLHKIGARRWIARIMVSWGVLSACMVFVQTPAMFYMLRCHSGEGHQVLLSRYGLRCGWCLPPCPVPCRRGKGRREICLLYPPGCL
ncbi:MFS transporter [Pseudomonas asiatica]|nr:MFS transporter [Pseudomonas asiatica]